jgi:hypothetical protein
MEIAPGGKKMWNKGWTEGHGWTVHDMVKDSPPNEPGAELSMCPAFTVGRYVPEPPISESLASKTCLSVRDEARSLFSYLTGGEGGRWSMIC